MLCTLFLSILLAVADGVHLGTIEHAAIINTNVHLRINGTKESCICEMLSKNGSISGFNYFPDNGSCHLFYNYSATTEVQLSMNCSFVFLKLPSVSRCPVMCLEPLGFAEDYGFLVLTYLYTRLFDISVTTAASSAPLLRIYWPFDGDLKDVYSGYNGVSINNVHFFTPGITGYGSALLFNASRNQYLLINSSTNPNISGTSFTFQFWVYPYSLDTSSSGDRGMIGQCQSNTLDRCLHMTIRGNSARISFFSDWCNGSTSILPNNWYHLAYVYDYGLTSQTVYVNGLVDCIHLASGPLQIDHSTPLTIGYTTPLAPYYFDGLMDEVSLVGWARNASDILDAATLTAYYAFDNQSLLDSGPNQINGTGSNLIFANDTLLFNTSSSYFQASNFVLLSVGNRSYSFSLWVYPFRTNGSTILHVSQNNAGAGNWCLPFLGFDAQGRVHAQSWTSGGSVSVLGPLLPSNTWTHLCQTYSPSSGVRLYVNGSFFNASAPCDYPPRSSLPILTLGSSPQSVNSSCPGGSIQMGQYTGGIDEFRVYSRELNSTSVLQLAQ